jgi:hypothetical protein
MATVEAILSLTNALTHLYDDGPAFNTLLFCQVRLIGRPTACLLKTFWCPHYDVFWKNSERSFFQRANFPLKKTVRVNYSTDLAKHTYCFARSVNSEAGQSSLVCWSASQRLAQTFFFCWYRSFCWYRFESLFFVSIDLNRFFRVTFSRES